jgi:hypothetical protein
MTSETEARKTLLPSAIGWIALIALGGYAIVAHHAVGQAPGGYAFEWWHPTSFALMSEWGGGLEPWEAVLYGATPGALLALVVFLATRSAIARTLALSLAIVVTAFCYFGYTADGLWQSFHWRLSAVMVWVGLALGFALMSPALSKSWLRRGWVLRLLIYVPIAFAVVSVIRNATGTDETLAGNFSPWPGISVFGIEIGAYAICGGLLGIAIALGALSQWGKRPVVALLGLLAGAAFPAIWFQSRFSTTDASALIGIAILAAIVIGLSSITRGGDRAAVLGRRAAHFALGAALVVAPMFTGRAWADADYTLNKFVRARIAQSALAEYHAKEGVYPDSLSELTSQNYLEELPRPRVGFDLFYDLGVLAPIEFSYRGLGSSYVLEFVSTEWVQCAYNPPWADDAGGTEYEDEEYEDEYAGEDDESGEAWSCPSTRPELWGNDSGEEYEYEYEEEEEE